MSDEDGRLAALEAAADAVLEALEKSGLWPDERALATVLGAVAATLAMATCSPGAFLGCVKVAADGAMKAAPREMETA